MAAPPLRSRNCSTNDSLGSVDIAVKPDGNRYHLLYTVWDYQECGEQVYHLICTNSDLEVVELNTTIPNGVDQHPAIAVDNSGAIHWTYGGSDIHYRTSPASDTEFGPEVNVRVPADPSEEYHVDIAVGDCEDTWHIVYIADRWLPDSRLLYQRATLTDQQNRVARRLAKLEESNRNYYQEGVSILELAQSAYSLYKQREPSEQANLLRTLLSNCEIKGLTLYPTYRKPFNYFMETSRNEIWRAIVDYLRTAA